MIHGCTCWASSNEKCKRFHSRFCNMHSLTDVFFNLTCKSVLMFLYVATRLYHNRWTSTTHDAWAATTALSISSTASTDANVWCSQHRRFTLSVAKNSWDARWFRQRTEIRRPGTDSLFHAVRHIFSTLMLFDCLRPHFVFLSSTLFPLGVIADFLFGYALFFLFFYDYSLRGI